MRKLIRKYLLSGCLLLSACSHLPSDIKNPPPGDISYVQAIQNIERYKNSTVRWGGVIIGVENYQYHNFVQVLIYPLDNTGRPDLYQNSIGRFMIKSVKFLDPLIYKSPIQITSVGTLDGIIERTIGTTRLALPVVVSELIHLWPSDTGYHSSYSNPSYSNPSYYWGLGGYGGYNLYNNYGGYNGHPSHHKNKGHTYLPSPPAPSPPPSPPPCGYQFNNHQFTTPRLECPPPPPDCNINEVPDGLGGCKPKHVRCENDAPHDDLGNCITPLLPTPIPEPPRSDIRCESNEIPDGLGGCRPKRIRCESNEILDSVGDCQPVPPKPPTDCGINQIADGLGGCRSTTMPLVIDSLPEQPRQEQESAAQQQQERDRQRQEQESAAQQQQEQDRQRQEQESAAQQQQERDRQRQEQESAAQQAQPAAPTETTEEKKKRHREE